jgi:hypothetical protein
MEGREGRGSVVPDIVTVQQRLCDCEDKLWGLWGRAATRQAFFFGGLYTPDTMSVALLQASAAKLQSLCGGRAPDSRAATSGCSSARCVSRDWGGPGSGNRRVGRRVRAAETRYRV